MQTPDVIIEKHAPAEGAERESKFLFIKTFVKPDGSRFIHFESVTVLKDGMDVSISSHEIGDKALRKEMQNGTILHLNSKLSSGFDKYLTKTPTERPDLAPTSDNRLVISSSLGGGVSPISHADDAAPAISLQSRNDDELSASKDTQSVSTEQTDKKEISEKSAESNVEVTNEEVMRSISPIEGYTYSEVIDMVQNDVENILSEEGIDNVEAVEFWAHGSRMRGNAKEDSDLDVVMFYKGNEKEDSLFNLINEHELAIDGIKVDVNPIRISNEQDIARYKEKSARYDQEMRFSLAGLHNISEEKLKKAIKQGGKLSVSLELDGDGHIVAISNIKSVHSKDAIKEVERLMDMGAESLRDNLKWVEKEEVSDWLLRLPYEDERTKDNPKLSSVANVLLSFQNPPIIGDESSQNVENAKSGEQKYSLPGVVNCFRISIFAVAKTMRVLPRR